MPIRRDGKRSVRTKSKQTDIDRTSCKSHIQAPLRFVNQHSAKMKLSIILRSCDGGSSNDSRPSRSGRRNFGMRTM